MTRSWFRLAERPCTRLSRKAWCLLILVMPTAPAAAETLNDLVSVQIVSSVRFEDQVATARALGVHRVRLAIRWNDVERPKGRFTWRPSDDRINALLRAGVSPILVLFGGNGGYKSAAPDGGGPPASGEALDGFGRFAAAAAARYRAVTPTRPILFEVWNEPNTKTFWGRPPDPEGYARMAEAACIAIKHVAPQARVVVLGMEGTPVKAPYRVAAYNIDIYQEWAARAATPTLTACADGLSMHPYLPAPEMQLSSDPQLRAFIAGHWTGSAAPIIVNSEVGYTIDAAKGRTDAMQAALDLRALLIGSGLGRVTNLYQSVDGGRDAQRPELTFGMATYDGRIKPAGLAVQRLMRAIGDYQIGGVAVVAAADASKVYRFDASLKQAKAQVWWSAGKPTLVAVPANAHAVDLVDGETKAITNGQLLAGPTPTLVTW